MEVVLAVLVHAIHIAQALVVLTASVVARTWVVTAHNNGKKKPQVIVNKR